VSLGVDGSASNDCSNLIQEVRQAMLLQRVGQTTQPLSHEVALNWATVGGARVLRRPELGHLQIGAAADLALFELTEPRFSGVEDPLAGLILSGAHRASRVMVNGHWQVVGGELANVDLDALVHEHNNLAIQLLQAN
ncbi:MAG: amidohydrolase family protein, partial [Pseudomonadota bacterium]